MNNMYMISRPTFNMNFNYENIVVFNVINFIKLMNSTGICLWHK